MWLLLALAISMVPVSGPIPLGDATATLGPTKTGCACADATTSATVTWQHGTWLCQSNSFCVQAHDRRCAMQVAEQCEQWKHRLSRQWLGQAACRHWETRCVVVVHRSASAYRRAVGAPVATAGASTLHVGAHGVLERRIDLRGDQLEAALAALPHEMTHVVLADLFSDLPPPAWADEGMATLADLPSKQARHAADLRTALVSGRCYRVVELLAMVDYPPPSRMHVFYAQSASLVQFLAELGGRESVPRFVLAAREVGYDAAVRSLYRLDGVGELEERWRRHAAGQR